MRLLCVLAGWIYISKPPHPILLFDNMHEIDSSAVPSFFANPFFCGVWVCLFTLVRSIFIFPRTIPEFLVNVLISWWMLSALLCSRQTQNNGEANAFIQAEVEMSTKKYFFFIDQVIEKKWILLASYLWIYVDTHYLLYTRRRVIQYSNCCVVKS